MSAITFFAAGIPKGQPRPRAFARKIGNRYEARVYDASTAEGWKGEVAIAARMHRPPSPLVGPIEVNLTFYFPRPKSHFNRAGHLRPDAPLYMTSVPDRDNCDKALLDALTALGFWQDDAQVCAGRLEKRYADCQTGCRIEITPL